MVSVTLSPDGTHLLTGSLDGIALLFSSGLDLVGSEGEGEGEGEGEASQEIAQALIDDFNDGDTDGNGMLSFAEAQGLFAALTLAEFDALDTDRNGELNQLELEDAGAVPGTGGEGEGKTGGGCFKESNSPKIFTDLKNFFGELFLLGLLTIVLVAWRGFGGRP